MTPFRYTGGRIPLLISVPHAGTALPGEIKNGLSDNAQPLPDTDWHVERLYDFANQLGAHMLVANYSRFVVDLNRPADDQPLYSSATTGLFPETLFDGSATFLPGKAPSAAERQGYLDHIWRPYHLKLQQTLDELKAEFGYALLFDAHSIASVVPRLFDGKLPDLNLGTNDGQSLDSPLEQALRDYCQSQSRFSWVLNGRFKGGYITRAYGKPEQKQQALQLELAQCNYMQETAPFAWRQDQAEQLIPVLTGLISQYLASAKQLYQP
ncbi:N-formylglutamate deformylase [Gallaecimonas mangrovi]|uniref:N-formylglutamate deformylase n=1 Tax=Gallaecimonas mangrovi TaxID=2291597 RepID=UPI000E209C7D|nr:N-formylglutamate deformylase [Gallaecimonas mangrovi]